MAHGFGAERSFAIPLYAEFFAERGFAVLLFDYRNFGSNSGEPRNWISPKRQIADWKAAIAHAFSIPEIDPARVALWGTSFSSGHIIVAAAGRNDIKALSLLVPFSDGFRSLFYFKFSFVLRAVVHGLIDVVSSLFGRAHRVPIMGRPEEFALLNTPECAAGYSSIVNPLSSWDNLAPARIALTLPLYRPVSKVGKLRCPVFIVAGEKDTLVPFPTVQRLARSIPGSMMMLLPTGHFEPYSGVWFERTASAQFQFLREALSGRLRGA